MSMRADWVVAIKVTPSFGRCLHLCIAAELVSSECSPNGGWECWSYWIARGSDWDWDAEVEEMTDGRSTALSPEVGMAVYSQLSSVAITPVASQVIGLDGTTYSLRVVAGFNSVRYVWWNDLPPEWSSLKPAVDLLLSIADRESK